MNEYGTFTKDSHSKKFKFKGIKANFVTGKNERLYSGQIVNCGGRITSPKPHEVTFDPNFGFKVKGENLSDAYITHVIKDISLWTKIKGAFSFLLFNLNSK